MKEKIENNLKKDTKKQSKKEVKIKFIFIYIYNLIIIKFFLYHSSHQLSTPQSSNHSYSEEIV